MMTVALPVASLELKEAHLDDKYLKLGSTKIETAEEVRQSHPCRKKNTSLLQAAHLQLPPPLQKVPPAPCLDYHRSQIILGWLHGVGDVLEMGSSWMQSLVASMVSNLARSELTAHTSGATSASPLSWDL